jgi:hypothetical protein
MVKNMLANGKIINKMAKVLLLQQMGDKVKEFG